MKTSFAGITRLFHSRGFILALAALGPLILVGRELVIGRALFWGTPALQFAPWWMEGTRQLLQGHFPLWNAASGMGAPLLANYQTAFFYPPNWTLFAFAWARGAAGVAWGYTFLAMLHLIWGGWGMVSLLRKLGASPLAQAIGGMAFALCGYLIGRLEFISMIWAAAWLPWVIRYTDDLASPVSGVVRVASRGWLRLPLVACLAMQLAAGHAQLSWYTLELAGAWLVFGMLRAKSIRAAARPLAQFAAAGLVAAGLAAVQLLPTAEYLMQSQRASQVEIAAALTYSFWPWRLVSLLAPNFFGNPGEGSYWGYASYWEDHAYVGVLALFMAFSTLRRTFARSREGLPWLDRYALRFLWGIVAASLLLALGNNTPVFPLLYHYVPSFDMFQAPARYLIWLTFAVILLAAAGVDAWRYPTGRGLYWLRLGTAGAFAIAGGAGLGWLFLQDVRLTFVQALALAGLWALGVGVLALLTKFRETPRWKAVWQAAVLCWLLADLLAAGWKLNPTVPVGFYDPRPRTGALAEASLNGQRVYMSNALERFLKFYRFFRFGDYSTREGWGGLRAALLPNLSLLDGIASANNFDPFVPARYADWMNVLERATPTRQAAMLARMDVGWVEVFDGRAAEGVRFERFDGGVSAAWYGCAEAPSGDDVLLEMAQRDFSADRLVVEGADALTGECAPGRGRQIERSVGAEGEVVYRLRQEQDGWLFISQVFYPGWTAVIDGVRAPVYAADYLFTAVRVPAGEHAVRLEYRPISFTIGGLLSILMSIGMAVVRCVPKWNKAISINTMEM